ncbi:hypothetical protein GCM10009682_16880 [Luedemannella flava]|uniref:Glycosyltransferase subfamily 4-like N-terminal domain-containing protein n=1 Tax=Luedemannella flava TaxID=349316 RepID=A0ABP4XZ87_9ACTN
MAKAGLRRVHVVEPGGRGGIYQHAVEVTRILVGAGVDAVLHTSDGCEVRPAAVPVCGCVRWPENGRNVVLRRAARARYLGGELLPHLCRAFGPRDVVHVHGFSFLNPMVIRAARLRRATVVGSPHNTFVREGAGSRAVRSHETMLRRPDHLVVYADADTAVLDRDASVLPLVQWTPPVEPDRVRRWRERLAPDGAPLALMPGHVRRDKNYDLFVRAMARLPGWRGGVVGEDHGGAAELAHVVQLTDAPVTMIFEYVSVADYMALVAAADVIVAPYAVASQSGVLAVARKLGVPTVATATGGLPELATAVADADPAALAQAVIQARGRGAAERPPDGVAAEFLAAYQVARARAG